MSRVPDRRRRITVIDDNPDFLEVMQEALSEEHDVIAFSGHEITPDHIVDSRPDLLIVDLRLDRGELQGWEIVTLVRAHRRVRTTPIVVCSADTQALTDRAAVILGAGNIALLSKPFDLDHLERVVRHGLTNGFPGGRGERDGAGYRSGFTGTADAILVADHTGR